MAVDNMNQMVGGKVENVKLIAEFTYKLHYKVIK